MRISEEKINEVLGAVNIVDLISGYIHLRKRGRNYIGLCPFHNEKTPSFTVSEEKQIFHCFGCHAGGNVYKFLMDYKSISFTEAVQELAEQYSIDISSDDDHIQHKYNPLETLYDINVIAARFFSDTLYNREEAKRAREYLNDRKIKLATQRAFGLGYAPSGWNNLLNHLNENKIDLHLAQSLGIIDKKSGHDYYDKYRDRIIFPILSPNGRVIAFGGRILENNDNVAKYLNSPESEIYQKRKVLYGLFHSKDEIRTLDKAILVEGYMDLISLYQNGVKNVVASSGTALTPDQIQLLSRYTKNIVVLFDADNAGQKAAMRSIELLLEQDFDVKVLTLPDGEDPDSYIKNYGKSEFDEQLKHSRHFLEYQSLQLQKMGYFDDPVKMTEAVRILIKTTSLVKDQLKRNILIKDISKKFNLREKLIEEESVKFIKEQKEQNSRKFESSLRLETEKKNIQQTILNPREKEIISLLFEGEEKISGFIFDHILPEDFTDETLGKIASVAYEEFMNNNLLPAVIIDKIEDPELKTLLLSLLTQHTVISKKWDDDFPESSKQERLYKYASDVIKSYLVFQIDQQIKNNQNILATLKDENEILELLSIINELTEEKQIMLNKNIFS